jgi:hypothetical protein
MRCLALVTSQATGHGAGALAPAMARSNWTRQWSDTQTPLEDAEVIGRADQALPCSSVG